jgi:excisionase family DNA binding protein
MKNSEPPLYSAEQVAELLGLHVRTVRNYVRDGRLKAVRIGKQYRIAKADLDALTGHPAAAEPAQTTGHLAEVTSVVQLDAIDPDLADRLGTFLVAAAQTPRDTPDALRIQTIHDRERAKMKIVILGGVAATADVLQTIEAILASAGTPDA